MGAVEGRAWELNLRLSFFSWVRSLGLQTFYPAMLRYQNILFRSLRFPVHFCCRKTGYFPFIIYAGNGEIITTKKVGRFTAPYHFTTLYNGNPRPFSAGARQSADSSPFGSLPDRRNNQVVPLYTALFYRAFFHSCRYEN